MHLYFSQFLVKNEKKQTIFFFITNAISFPHDLKIVLHTNGSHVSPGFHSTNNEERESSDYQFS